MSASNPPATRTARLRTLVDAAEESKGPTFDVPYQGNRQSFRRIRVEASLLLYRLQNGRTRRKQTEFLERDPSRGPDFFKDPEDPAAQTAQEQILLSLIEEKDLAADLDEKGQHSPLVLSADGIVLDGNRRLAALRRKGETHVAAVVLPATAEARDLYETEIELQMQRDTKAEYGWVERVLHVDFGIRELSESVATVAKRMRRDAADITLEQQMLELAKLYLTWLGSPGQFHKIPMPAGGDSEQSFRELAKGLNSPTLRKLSEPNRKVIREQCFQVIKDEGGYQAVRETIRVLSQDAGRVKERFEQRQLPFAGKSGATPQTSVALPVAALAAPTDDPLMALADEADTRVQGPLLELAAQVGTQEQSQQLRAIVEEIAAEAKETKRLPLQRLQKVLQELRGIEFAPTTPDTSTCSKTLLEISSEIDRLAKVLESLPSIK